MSKVFADRPVPENPVKALEARHVDYAIRIPANWNLELAVADTVFRLRGRPSRKPLVRSQRFHYQADRGRTLRWGTATVEHHAGELFPRVGCILTNLTRPSRSAQKSRFPNT